MLLQFSSDILNFQNSKIYKFNLKIPKSLFTNMPKYKMIEMVAEACFNINERGGTTRQKIWKYISTKPDFQDSIRTEKLFLAKLKKELVESTHVEKIPGNAMRYRLVPSFKTKMIQKMAKGESLNIKSMNTILKQIKQGKKLKKQSKLKKN